MIPLVYALIYNLLLFPLLFLTFHAYALFNRKYRRGVLGRYQNQASLANFLKTAEPDTREFFLVHCASLGEFEHLRPFLRELRRQRPASKTVVMFFSPSGYENVRSAPGVDLFIYAPFDWWLPVYRLLKKLRPIALIIAKYDVWPNQIWAARRLGIPRFLINATLYPSSSRLRPLARFFLRPIYAKFDRILAISEDDRQYYRQLAPAEKIVVVGDTKYDQAIFRSEESRQKEVLPAAVLRGKKVLVAGSTWPEDEVHLLPAVKALLEQFSDLLVIICPHEPTSEHLQQLTEDLHPLRVCRYSQLTPAAENAVILIDRIGLLANLYSAAHAAYVGGSFKQNIHNVLEPAAYGIPVLFGPVNRNSHEAQLLKQIGGAIEVEGREALQKQLRRIFSDDVYRLRLGAASRRLVEKHRGATVRTLQEVLGELSR